jgi:putative zinc finger/helix-turn-helix YgiT family protein
MTAHRATSAHPYRYEWSGLSHVRLVGIPVHECPNCGSIHPVIPHIDDLHHAISGVLVAKPGILTGREIRFLRKHAGFSSRDFAELLRVSNVHLSRVENEHRPVSRQIDKLARVLVAASQDADVKALLLEAARSTKSVSAILFRLSNDQWEIRAA